MKKNEGGSKKVSAHRVNKARKRRRGHKLASVYPDSCGDDNQRKR